MAPRLRVRSSVVRLVNLWDSLRSSFWFLPTLFTGAAVGLAVGLLALDRRAGLEELAESRWLYAGGPEGARSLLSAVAGSIVNVVALAFSITIVSLQLASAQLGPRLLRNFVRDRGNQVVLGTFVATFVYCLLVLRTVRGGEGIADSAFVPHLAVTGAVALALLSIGLLIYFIHHASTSIQADRVIAAVATDLEGAIDTLFPEPLGHAPPAADRAPAPAGGIEAGAAVAATTHGYISSIDGDTVLEAAGEADVLIRLAHRPGEFVIAGEPLAHVVPGERLDDRLARRLVRAFVVGSERTLIQDTFFGFEQLVEIATRALASNHIDPTTALRCIDRLAAAVAGVSQRRLPSPCRRDTDGIVRVVAPAPTIRDFVGAAFTAIRLQGSGNRTVALHLLETFERLAALRGRRDLHVALLDEAVAIRRAATRALDDGRDREAVDEAFERLLASMDPDVRGIYNGRAAA